MNRKDRVHMSEWNASRKYQYAMFELPQVTELKCLGGTYPVEQWRHEYVSEQEAAVWMNQLEDDSAVVRHEDTTTC